MVLRPQIRKPSVHSGWKLLAVSVALIAALGGGIWLARWIREMRARERASIAIAHWHLDSQEMMVAVAAEEWGALKQHLGSAYDLLPAGERAQPYFTLSNKYYAEGQWEPAFEMRQEAYEVIGYTEPPAPEVLYLAALAGRAGWLNNRLSQEADKGRRLLISACIAWAEGRYTDILKMTNPDELVGPLDTASSGNPPLRPWLGFLRARAFAEKGSFREALVAINSEVASSLARMTDKQYFGLHVVIVIAEIGEHAGDLRGALTLSEIMMKQGSPLCCSASWAAELKRNEERVLRLRKRLGIEDRKPGFTRQSEATYRHGVPVTRNLSPGDRGTHHLIDLTILQQRIVSGDTILISDGRRHARILVGRNGPAK